MKTYEKPGVTLIDLLQEERIAANFYWVWTGVTPDADKVEAQYQKYLLENFGPYSTTWECGFRVVS